MAYRVVNEKRYRIDPVPAPRMNRLSRFNPQRQRTIARYNAFRDLVRLLKVTIPDSCYVRFEMPVPKKGKRRIGHPHAQRPDLDNLLKALLDSVFTEDAHIARVLAEKVWALRGSIVVGELEVDDLHE